MTEPVATDADITTGGWYRRRSRRSELLSQVRGDGRVVAQGFVQLARLGPMVTGGQLDERGAALTADALGLCHQSPPDASLAGAGVNHERDDPDDRVVVLESRQCGEGDEPEQGVLVLGDDDLCVVGSEPVEAGDDIAGTGRVALVREQRRDRLGVGRGCTPELDGGLVGHARMVPAPSATRSRCGPVSGSPRTSLSGPSGPGAPANAGRRRDATAYQATTGPS